MMKNSVDEREGGEEGGKEAGEKESTFKMDEDSEDRESEAEADRGGVSRPPRVKDVFSVAARIYSKNAHIFLLLWAIPSVLSFILLTTFVLSAGEISDSGGQVSSSAYFFFSLTLVASATIYTFFSAPIIVMVSDELSGREVSFDRAFSALGSRPLVMLLASALLASLVVLGGRYLCYLPGILFCYWWLFAVIILVLEERGIRESFAMSRSISMQKGGFPLAIVFFTAVFLAMFLVQFFVLFFFNSPSSVFYDIAVFTIMTIFFWFFFPFFITAIVVAYFGPETMDQG